MAGMHQRAPGRASDAWLAEQQMRAEMEAEAWRRLRLELAAAPPALPAPSPQAPADPYRGGSIILKGLVRFAIAAFAAYVAFIAAADSQLGEFEVWLAIGSAFVVTLALSMFGPLRAIVHFLSETARWVLILGFGFGALWLLLNPPA